MRFLFLFFLSVVIGMQDAVLLGQDDDSKIWKVRKTADFKVTGHGDAVNWKETAWRQIPQRAFGTGPLATRIKVLYSETGMYFLFNCEDRKLTATMNADFMDLWKEDVVEVFLWTDEATPAYFEYEISPLNYELPILISNEDGDLVRWQPFHYDADRKTSHAVSLQEKDGGLSSWTAEFYIPYKLLRPLKNIQPKAGTLWRANFYRVDYDKGKSNWSWQKTRKSFHDYRRFGTLMFE